VEKAEKRAPGSAKNCRRLPAALPWLIVVKDQFCYSVIPFAQLKTLARNVQEFA